MKKPQRRGPAPSAPAATLAARGAEALAQERFKEAIELFKLAIRQDPQPAWQASLADAYAGRARALAAKKMFKEAAMVLENTLAPDSTLRDPLLYLHCLIRDGQQPKAAAHALSYLGRETAVPEADRAALEELTAALLVAVPQRPTPVAAVAPPAGSPAAERTRWLELAASCRAALAAWVDGAPAEEIDRHLNRISLRSAFRPVRLLLKSLATAPADAERSRRLLEAIPPASPFFSFRQAVEAALPGGRALDTDAWSRLAPAQQAFVAQTRGLSAWASQFLARSAEAARGGAAALFTFLLKQPDLPQAEVRSACLNLLPQLPDRVAQFEKSFGALSPLERHRLQALGAEARGDWGKAERFWRAAADAIPGDDKLAGLLTGVIFRHLAALAVTHDQIEGDDHFADPVIQYLERSCDADPEHIPTVLDLVRRYREDGRDKDWHRLVDETVQRFPADTQVLMAATDSAMARKAYKKAAGFAHRLLKIDPINPTVRRQMIELQVSHARKQMRSKRSDLARKELAAAAEWERADAPSVLLRIARALVELQTGPREPAEARLREAIELAGGGVAGWFHAALEGELMKLTGADATLLRRGLDRARGTPPTREAVMAVVAALAQPEAGENKRALAGLLARMNAWLLTAIALDWPPAEFQALADILVRFDLFHLLAEYARAGRRREPTNPVWRFHEIVARAGGDPDRLSHIEGTELMSMAQAAAQRDDFQAVTRIERFLHASDDARPGSRRRRRMADDDDDFPEEVDADLVQAMLGAVAGNMPKAAGKDLRVFVAELGREATITMLVQEFRASPLGKGMTEAVARQMFETMIDMAMAGGPSGRGRRGSPF